jgi:excisionase family DNA binding protein
MENNSRCLIDINELSKRISVPRGTLYNWVYLHRIPFVKAGRSLRFDPDEVIRSMPHYSTIRSAGER